MNQHYMPPPVVPTKKPMVGKIVHLGIEPFAAMVTMVRKDGSVDLTVFFPGHDRLVNQNAHYAEGPEAGKWTWPPWDRE